MQQSPLPDQLISLDLDLLFVDRAAHYGIKPETVASTQAHVTEATSAIEKNVADGSYGFISELSNTTLFEQTQTVFRQISWAKQMIVVGIGGSDLGGRTIQQALQADTPPMEVLFHGDSTDPEQIRRLFLRILLPECVFVIISKSGETVETISQYLFWKEQFRANHPELDWSKHFVFITDAHKGILRKEADSFGVLTLPIPDTVGGRFSVLTPVGLLPAMAMGVACEGLLTGARAFASDGSQRQMAYDFAATQYQLYQQGMQVVVCMPYSIALEEFARWFRQLWAESLGKDGKGILPIQSRGPADQHSQGQFYNQGAPLQSVLFLRVEQPMQDFVLPTTDIPELTYLTGHTFQEICLAEQTATAQSLVEVGRPSATLTLKHLDAQTLGALFLFFELAVVHVAQLLEVNAFDQPGVEQGKQIMYRLLGKV